jgi:hypothetical protein
VSGEGGRTLLSGRARDVPGLEVELTKRRLLELGATGWLGASPGARLAFPLLALIVAARRGRGYGRAIMRLVRSL